jgi:hypothetical protein
MLENRVLRRICGPKEEEVTGSSRKLHNEKLHNLVSSPSIIMVMKLRRMRCMECETYMGKMRNACKILDGKHWKTCACKAVVYYKKFWRKLICLLSLHKSVI